MLEWIVFTAQFNHFHFFIFRKIFYSHQLKCAPNETFNMLATICLLNCMTSLFANWFVSTKVEEADERTRRIYTVFVVVFFHIGHTDTMELFTDKSSHSASHLFLMWFKQRKHEARTVVLLSVERICVFPDNRLTYLAHNFLSFSSCFSFWFGKRAAYAYGKVKTKDFLVLLTFTAST